MTDALFSPVQLEHPSHAGYRLHRVEVLNWGTFDSAVWRLAPNGETALLTGDIGSGKSTLVDAVTTLLLPANAVAYNRAAGAGNKERTLRSYVEGYYKSERTEISGRSKPVGIRSNRNTFSVILGVFSNEGYGETVTLAQVFWQAGTSGQPNRFYVTAPDELAISVHFAGFGSDVRALKKRLREAGAHVADTYPQYETVMRRLLGIASPQALDLFHQTVSMKSVGKLDDFVREHMLEPSDTDTKIAGIIAHFENLTVAHEAVVKARDQLAALDPIVLAANEYDDTLAQRTHLMTQRESVPLFVAELRVGLLDAELAGHRHERDRLRAQYRAAVARNSELTTRRERLIADRERAGGNRIGELERAASKARAEAAKRRERKLRFDAALAAADLDPVTDAEGFTRLASTLAVARHQLAAAKPGLDHEFNAAVKRSVAADERLAAVRAELEGLASRTSNLPTEQVEIRNRLCAAIGVPAAELPFAGELVDVAERFSQWRGAAERVLRPFALTMLVPAQHYEAASAWIDAHRLQYRGRGGGMVGGRLVYHRVPARRIAVQPPVHTGLWLLDCLDIRVSDFADYLRGELATRADYLCAETLSEFGAASRAVTRQGQMRSGNRHEKDDRHDVDDPRRWVLGWANERKVAALRADLAAAEREQADATAAADAVQHCHSQAAGRQLAITRLEDFTDWSDLDAAEARVRADAHDAERRRLVEGSSRLAEIDRMLGDVADLQKGAAETIEQLVGQLATTEATIYAAERDRAADEKTLTEAEPADLERARSTYDVLRSRAAALPGGIPHRSADCASTRGTLTDELQRDIDARGKVLDATSHRLTRSMGEMLGRWQEFRNNMDGTIESRSDFRALRERVASDDLPTFEAKFKEELNKNTIQELAAFNYWLGEQRDTIGRRVDVINEGLSAVEYNPGRHVRLEKEPTSNSDVVQFRNDLRTLTDDALATDDGQYSEQRFLEVKRIIERFRGREGFAELDKAWTRRVTDVRNWFVFAASERDDATGEEWEHYSDSDGKSGGQKEKLAYTILAASLAYQFGLEWGAEKARDFRFAVIDEAFGRGSDESTRYALTLFAKLGLQLLIVTPLQKVHVIEPFVKSIAFVDNPSGRSSRVHMMTIEEYHRGRQEHGR